MLLFQFRFCNRSSLGSNGQRWRLICKIMINYESFILVQLAKNVTKHCVVKRSIPKFTGTLYAVMAEGDQSIEGECMRIFRSIIFDIIREVEGSNSSDVRSFGHVHLQLQWLSHLLDHFFNIYPSNGEIERLVRAASNYFDPDSVRDGNREQLVENSGQKGRPRIIVPREQLELLIGLGFSTVNIALLLGVSNSTIKPRLSDFGIPIRCTYTEIADNALDEVILTILQDFPNTGYKRMTGFLRSRGLRIQQHRIRESMRRVDPAGVLLRSLEMRITQRRSYRVPGPLALWHIDGNHKLIRYSILIFHLFKISEKYGAFGAVEART